MDENEKKLDFAFTPESEKEDVIWNQEESETADAEVTAEEIPAENVPEPELEADEEPSPLDDYVTVNNPDKDDFDFDKAVTEQITAQIGAFFDEKDAEEEKAAQKNPASKKKAASASNGDGAAKGHKEDIQKKRANRKQTELQKKKRMRRLLLFGIVLLIAFIVLVTSLINLVRVLVRGRTENIGPLPSDTVVVHKVPIYYDYSQQVPEASPVSDSYFSDALFVGDTRVQCLDLYGVGNFQTLLYGTSIDVTTALSYSCKSSDGTDGTLNDKVSLNQYGKIYINLGMNELGWSNPDTFATNYRLLVEELKIKQPNAVIYICGIMPVSLKRDGRVSYITNDRIQKYNTLLRTVATDTQVYYLDCYDGIADEEGYLPSEQTSDGINLLEEGCQVWYNYLKTHTVNPEDYSN